MPYSFSTALSGLRASSDSLSVAGNNIANANTTAFKSTSISFADVYTNSIGVRLNGAGASVQIGNGVRTSATPTNFSQGTLTDDASSTSAAIEGNGFFVVEDNSGARSYTRAGDFSPDREGFLRTPGGQQVMGYPAVNGQIPPGSVLAPLRIPIGETVAPTVTSEATLRLNLNSTDAAGGEFHAPVQVYDSKGVVRSLDLVFTKQPDNSYLLSATLDGNPAQLSSNGGAASPAPVAVTFDSNGNLTQPTSLSVVPDQTQLDGATLPSIAFNLRETNPDGTPGAAYLTNYAAPSAVAATDQNGSAAGTLKGLALSVDGDGTLMALFSNGQLRPLGQMALATFNSQAGLSHLGGNLYGETSGSGQPSIGTAGSGGRGGVVGSALEQSNVDIANEFTNLIIAQRGFQANSRVITTINQTLQELLQTI